MDASGSGPRVRVVTASLEPAEIHAADADRLKRVVALCTALGAYTRAVAPDEAEHFPALGGDVPPQITVLRDDAQRFYTVCVLYGPRVVLTAMRTSALVRTEPLHISTEHVEHMADLSDPAMPRTALRVRVQFDDHALAAEPTHVLGMGPAYQLVGHRVTVPQIHVAGAPAAKTVARTVRIDLNPADYHTADAGRLALIAAKCVDFGTAPRILTPDERARYPAAERAHYEAPQVTLARDDAQRYYTLGVLYGPHVVLTAARAAALVELEPAHVSPAHLEYTLDLADPELPMTAFKVRVQYHNNPLNVTPAYLLSFNTYTTQQFRVAGSEHGNGTVVRRTAGAATSWASNANSPRHKRPRHDDE